jgi:hypothetical protein
MDAVGERKTKIVIEVIPHPRSKGDWQVRCQQLLPWPIWFKDHKDAISYANWLGREYDVELT